MPLRMAEYCLGILRLFGQFPRQVVLYVGEAPLTMGSELRGPDVSFRYRMIDIRDLDGDRLLESEETGDNVSAILARLRDHSSAIHKSVGRIAGLPAAERDAALSQLLILAGLRRLEETVERRDTKNAGLYRHPGKQSIGNRVLRSAWRRVNWKANWKYFTGKLRSASVQS